jgi:broad specificity phosphatase PhoE
MATVGRLVASDETKAVETAGILADRLGLAVEIRLATGETDRSATGWVPPERHDELAARYFADPERSADGWERAIDSQRRVVAALADLLVEPGGRAVERARPDVVVVGHGGVGTLLWCHLAGLAIDRRHDQPSQGHHWAWDRSTGRVVHPWRPIDR